MSRIHSNRRAQSAAAALLILPVALGLAACGGSSKDSAATTNAGAATANGKRGGQFEARASALRACLQKQGITLPKRPLAPGGSAAGGPPAGGPGGDPYSGRAPGGGPGARGPFGRGARIGPRLPEGVTRAHFEAALKKCGGAAFGHSGRLDSAQARERFAKFAQCMRRNGVNLPAPNTSGNGPIFNTRGIDTNSAPFKAADAKCMKELRPRGVIPGPNGEREPAPAPPGAPGTAPEGPPPGA